MTSSQSQFKHNADQWPSGHCQLVRKIVIIRLYLVATVLFVLNMSGNVLFLLPNIFLLFFQHKITGSFQRNSSWRRPSGSRDTGKTPRTASGRETSRWRPCTHPAAPWTHRAGSSPPDTWRAWQWYRVSTEIKHNYKLTRSQTWGSWRHLRSTPPPSGPRRSVSSGTPHRCSQTSRRPPAAWRSTGARSWRRTPIPGCWTWVRKSC